MFDANRQAALKGRIGEDGFFTEAVLGKGRTMDWPLSPYDLVMLVVLIATTIFGIVKGMAWQAASLASLIVSAAVAIHFSAAMAPYFSEHAPWNRFLAALVLFVLTSAAIWWLFRLVAGVIDRLKLKDWDRQLGGVLGFIKGVLLCMVITFFVLGLSEPMRQTVLASRSGYWMAVAVGKGYPMVPEEVRAVIGEYIDEFHRRLTIEAATGPNHVAPPFDFGRETPGSPWGGEHPPR